MQISFTNNYVAILTFVPMYNFIILSKRMSTNMQRRIVNF